MKTTVPKSGLERGVVFGVRFIFCMKTTIPKSGLETGVVFVVGEFLFFMKITILKVVLKEERSLVWFITLFF